MIKQPPPASNLPFLPHDVQLAEDRASGLLAQENDPSSLLRQALNCALDQSEAGRGIDHETVRSRYLA